MEGQPVEVHFTLDNGTDLIYEVDSVDDAVRLITSVFAGQTAIFMEDDDDDPDETTAYIHTYYYPVHRIKDAGYSIEKDPKRL